MVSLKDDMETIKTALKGMSIDVLIENYKQFTLEIDVMLNGGIVEFDKNSKKFKTYLKENQFLVKELDKKYAICKEIIKIQKERISKTTIGDVFKVANQL